MSCFNNLANIYNNKIIKPHFLKTQPKSKIIEYLTRQKLLRSHTHPYKKDDSVFGASLAINDKYIVVGAPSGDADNKEGDNTENNNIPDQGYVEVFEITTSGKIIKYTKGNAFQDDGTIRPHTHDDKENYKKDDAFFGYSVAINDKYIVVGAPKGFWDNQGYVEVFEITSNGINKFSKGNAFEKDDGTIRPHTHPDKKDWSEFGTSVSLNSKYIVVGARFGDADNKEGNYTKNNIPNQGYVEVFEVKTNINNIRDQGYVEVFEIKKSGKIIKYTKGDAFQDDGTIRPHTHYDKENYKKDNASFGTGLAINDKYIVVGAEQGNADIISWTRDQGYVEVFEITSSGINKFSKGSAFEKDDGTIRPHTHDDTLDDANFGFSVAINDKYIVVGAIFGDADNIQAPWYNGSYDCYRSVSQLGSNINNIRNQGYVEVFEITKSGIHKFSKGNAFQPDDGTIRPHTHPYKKDNSRFGYSVALNSKYIIVGATRGDADNIQPENDIDLNDLDNTACRHSKDNQPNQGYVEVFEITSSGINKYSKGNAFQPDNGTIRPHTQDDKKDSAWFGRSVAINDKYIVVGAPFGDADDIDGNDGESDQGYVEVFEITKSGIHKFSKGNAFQPDDGTIRPHTHPYKKDNAIFGWSVAINDKYIVVGAPYGDADNKQGDYNDLNNIPNQGYVEVFKITSSGINKFSKGSVFEKDKTIRPHTHADKKNYKKDSLGFGHSVALNDHFLIAGADWTDADNKQGDVSVPNNQRSQGLVEVFQFKREIL